MDTHKDTLRQIAKLLTEQNEKLSHSLPANNDFWSNFNNSVTYPFLLSILSAIVFWLIFSYWPEKNRRNRLRPKVELDMYAIYTALFSYLDLAMRPAEHTVSSFQDMITGGNMTKDLFEQGLLNKCKNNFHKYYLPIAGVQISIGKEQYECVEDIDKTIERIFNFQECLTVDEILLLEKMRKTLQFYPLRYYDEDPVVVLGSQVLRPVNSSLSYMSENYKNIYDLFIVYQKIIFSCETIADKVFTSHVQHLYYSDNWRNCKTVIEHPPASFTGNEELLSGYLILCEYKLENKHRAYELLREYLRLSPHLVSNRPFLADLLGDQVARSILKNYYTSDAIKELEQAIEDDEERYRDFIKQANFLEAFFTSQDHRGGPKSATEQP